MTSFIAVILTVLSLVQIGWAQIGYNANTNSLLCSKPGGHYCVHGSLQGPIMISCVSITTAEIRSCNIELANILPPGYEDMAICYETDPSLGDALCAFNGTGYPRSGKPVPIPETTLCSTDSTIGESNSYDGSDEDAIDSDSDIDSGSYYSPSPSYPDDTFNVSRKRLEFTILDSEPELERKPEYPQPTITTTNHPDNENGTIQTIPSLPFPLPVTPVDSLPVSSTLTNQLKPTVNNPSQPQPPCVPQLGVRDPNTTVECATLSDLAFAVLTSIPTSIPTSALDWGGSFAVFVFEYFCIFFFDFVFVKSGEFEFQFEFQFEFECCSGEDFGWEGVWGCGLLW
ncbi:hypothetical protein N8T08_005342 [Aspergillus melleus]|uniref:Uncharacterized protein n=1 Tax=Aspergillus melleus TaxID=138277 RepID=A0ACC3B264_9EURO|nr:hypothetical protein N8T08_005342 [Aspergillus melleus]